MSRERSHLKMSGNATDNWASTPLGRRGQHPSSKQTSSAPETIAVTGRPARAALHPGAEDEHRTWISEVETLLTQADGFVRGGDYQGALARAQCARAHLANNVRSSPDVGVREAAIRDRIDLVIGRYDQLVLQWRTEVARRQQAYLTRERSAIARPAR